MLLSYPQHSQEQLLSVLLANKSKTKAILKAILDVTKSGEKRLRLEAQCPPPSQIEQHPQFFLQLMSHRPKHGLHVTLQVEPFGKFIDEMKKDDVEAEFLELMQLSQKYASEAVKRHDLESVLRKLFPEYVVGSKEWGSRANAKSDLCVVDKDNYVMLNVECKKELASGGAEPTLECMGYFIHFQKAHTNQRSPMFLLTAAGPYLLQVFGATWEGDNFCIDPLIPPASLLYVPSDPARGVMVLAKIFRALKSVIGQLPLIPSFPNSGPYFRRFGELELTHVRKTKHLRVFKACVNDKPVILKFSLGQYGLEVHDYLSSQGLAPKIVHAGTLPGGWHVVVMERFSGISLPEKINESQKAYLLQVLACLDSKNFVHGDLRPPNILANNTIVQVIDFDWAGVQGTARYPATLNMSDFCGWHPDVKRGGDNSERA